MNSGCSFLDIKLIKMSVFSFKHTIPEQQAFFSLFKTTGWNNKYQLDSQQLYNAMENSWYLVSAYENENLVGFGRIICDGIVHALIIDLIVHPDYQKQGIGGILLDKLLDKCKQHQIRDIQLFSAMGYSAFYEKRGFRKRHDDAPGMECNFIV